MPIVLQKFKVAVNAGNGKVRFEEIEGSEIKNEYGLDLFVHKSPTGEYKVSEMTTGCSITKACALKRDAVNELHEVVKKHGVEKIKEQIKIRESEIEKNLV
jgi:hypothetical protein